MAPGPKERNLFTAHPREGGDPGFFVLIDLGAPSRRIELMNRLLFALIASAALFASDADALDNRLADFLRGYVGSGDRNLRVIVGTAPLTGNGREQILVYLNGRDWCGSGGCTTLVLTEKGRRYKVLSRITITRLPVTVLRSTSNGWRDLGVGVGGGGIGPGRVRLSFNGRGYPTNPTVAPAKRIKADDGAVVLHDTDPGEVLFK